MRKVYDYIMSLTWERRLLWIIYFYWVGHVIGETARNIIG
mgnify:CR=1 FL=1